MSSSRIHAKSRLRNSTLSKPNFSPINWCHLFVSGNAHVYGNACIWGKPGSNSSSPSITITDNAKVCGNACIHTDNTNGITISGNAHVYGNAYLAGYVEVTDDARVAEDAEIVSGCLFPFEIAPRDGGTYTGYLRHEGDPATLYFDLSPDTIDKGVHFLAAGVQVNDLLILGFPSNDYDQAFTIVEIVNGATLKLLSSQTALTAADRDYKFIIRRDDVDSNVVDVSPSIGSSTDGTDINSSNIVDKQLFDPRTYPNTEHRKAITLNPNPSPSLGNYIGATITSNFVEIDGNANKTIFVKKSFVTGIYSSSELDSDRDPTTSGKVLLSKREEFMDIDLIDLTDARFTMSLSATTVNGTNTKITIKDNAQVGGNAFISGFCEIGGHARITGNARVFEAAVVDGGQTSPSAIAGGFVGDDATVSGQVHISDKGRLAGHQQMSSGVLYSTRSDCIAQREFSST